MGAKPPNMVSPRCERPKPSSNATRRSPTARCPHCTIGPWRTDERAEVALSGDLQSDRLAHRFAGRAGVSDQIISVRGHARAARSGSSQAAKQSGRKAVDRFSFRTRTNQCLGDHWLRCQRQGPRPELDRAQLYPVIDLLVLDHVDHVNQRVEARLIRLLLGRLLAETSAGEIRLPAL